MEAVKQSDSEGSGLATCPLCGDYKGEPSSVEAHISRMTDLQHQGEVGRAHRDQLQRESRENNDGSGSGSTSVDATDESGVGSSDESGVESSDQSGSVTTENRENDESTTGFRESPEGGVAPSGDTDGEAGDLETGVDETHGDGESDENEPGAVVVDVDDGSESDEDLCEQFDQLADEIERIDEQIADLDERVSELEGRDDRHGIGRDRAGTDPDSDEMPAFGIPWILVIGIVAVGGGIWWFCRHLSSQSSGSENDGSGGSSGKLTDEEVTLVEG